MFIRVKILFYIEHTKVSNYNTNLIFKKNISAIKFFYMEKFLSPKFPNN